MTDLQLCVGLAVMVMLGILVLVMTGIRMDAHKGGLSVSEAMDLYRQAKTWDEKIVFFIFNLARIVKGGFWGAVVLVSGILAHLVAVVCGHNPLPYYVEMWDRFLDYLTDREEGKGLAPATD